MRFNVKKIEPMGYDAENLFVVNAPYYLANQENSQERNEVIYFGCDFKNLPRGFNSEEFIKTTNECLEYIRRECAGCKLYYKPHPRETDEYKSLNLESFEMEHDKTIGEYFLYKKLNRIKFVFSACSAASISAYDLGLNSYIFSPLYKSALGPIGTLGYENLFGGAPETFFISDLNQKLEENRARFGRDQFLERQWAELLKDHNGRVWLFVNDPGFLPTVASFAKLIKTLSPGREASLIITRHERWNSINTEDLKKDFDQIVFFPLIRYSLRPSNLFQLLKTAWNVKRFKINQEDIFFAFGPGSFEVNFFLSYHRNNFSIGLIREYDFESNFNFKAPLKKSDYQIGWKSVFFSKVIEPILGIHRSIRRLEIPGTKGAFAISRFKRPLNQIFNITYVLKMY